MASIVAICNALLGLLFTLENLVHSVDVRMTDKNSQNTCHWGYVFKRGFLFRLRLARWHLLGWSHCENGQAHDQTANGLSDNWRHPMQ